MSTRLRSVEDICDLATSLGDTIAELESELERHKSGVDQWFDKCKRAREERAEHELTITALKAKEETLRKRVLQLEAALQEIAEGAYAYFTSYGNCECSSAAFVALNKGDD